MKASSSSEHWAQKLVDLSRNARFIASQLVSPAASRVPAAKTTPITHPLRAPCTFQTDAQIASRFCGVELPRWQQNEDFRGFLAGFERRLPLRQPSRISGSRAMVSAIMSATSGITGNISELLSRAAEAAIRSKKECITPELPHNVIGARTSA